MITITISRTPPKQDRARERRPWPWRKITIGLVAAAVIVGGASWCVPYALDAPRRNYVEAIRALSAPELNAQRTDEDVMKIVNNSCDGHLGESIGDDLTDDPQYFSEAMPRDEYVAIADEYCASR